MYRMCFLQNTGKALSESQVKQMAEAMTEVFQYTILPPHSLLDAVLNCL